MLRLGVDRNWTPSPLNTAALMRRMEDRIRADEAPAVPALCLRLTHYAHRLNPRVEVAGVHDWAATCYRRWLENLARHDAKTVRATLETDPGNLVLGAKALADATLCAKCVRAQLDLYERAGMTLPRLNQTVLGSLLGPDDPRPAASLLGEPLSAAELLADASPTSLAALGLLSQRARNSREIPAALVAALALRSVWMRDLSGVGLTLLGAALVDAPVPPGLFAWIARIARDDGFFGMWELYAEPHSVANLVGTVNIYWGLSVAAAQHDAPLRSRPTSPEPEPEAPPPLELQRAIKRAQLWLDGRSDRFSLLPACRDEEHFESTFKPLVELALLCHVLTRPRHDNLAWARWARRTAERLHSHIEWEGLIEAFRLRTSATLGIAIYGLLQSTTGRECRFAHQARELLVEPFAVAQERTPMREMDYQFTRVLMGLPMTLPLSDQLSRTLLREPFDPTYMDTDALYDLTHIALYATQFGCVPWAPPSNVRFSWPGNALESMTLARLLMGDADLGSELLLTQFYTREAPGPIQPRCLRLLLDAQTTDGSFLGPETANDAPDEFSARYHTTLVAIAALAESLVSQRRTTALVTR